MGAIGSRNDQGRLSEFPSSHVGAILQNSTFELIAVVDPDPSSQEAFRRDWSCHMPLLSSMDDTRLPAELDLVVVASPTHTHFSILYQALNQKKLKAIFCEKPFCSNLSETQKILIAAKTHGTQIVVNYHRRWDPKIADFRREIQSHGTPSDVQAFYGNGLYNYGSHIIDLMVSIWGPVDAVCADRLRLPESRLDDPSLSATLKFFSGFCGRLNGCDEVDYDLCDIEVSFRNCRFRLEAGGYKINKLDGISGLYFPGYSHLRKSESDYRKGPVCGLRKAYEEIAVFLEGGAIPTTSDGTNALHVAEVLDAIQRSAGDRGKMITI